VSTTAYPMLELLLHKSDSLCIGSLSNQFPVDFISACGTAPIAGSGFPTFRRRGYHAKIVAAHRQDPAKYKGIVSD
jgi:hypothetical protein